MITVGSEFNELLTFALLRVAKTVAVSELECVLIELIGMEDVNSDEVEAFICIL